MSGLQEGVKAIRAVQRTLEILDLFLQRPGPFGVGEVARMTGHPKSTVYRMLLTLASQGYLGRNTGTDKFRLGQKLLSVRVEKPAPDLRSVAQSVIEGLRDTCGETVGLHLLQGDERICIASAEGIRNLRTSAQAGSRAPLYSGASARAIMAFLPEERCNEIIARTGLAPITSKTITDPGRLRRELERIRTEGYALSAGEWEEGITSLAAPLFGSGGSVVGSINISGPSFRFGQEKISLLVGALKAAAAVISDRLKSAVDDAGPDSGRTSTERVHEL